MLRCEDFERRLQEVLDLRQRPQQDPSLAAHASVCETCRENMADQIWLLDALRREDVPAEQDDELATRVLADVEDVTDLRTTKRLGTWTVLAIVALLLIALIPNWAPRLGGPRVANRPETVIAASPVTPGIMNPELPRSPDNSAAAVLENRVNSPRVSGWIAQRGAFPNLPAELELLGPLFQGIPDPQLSHVDELAGGLRPLADSFTAAFDALRRSFPIHRSHGEPPERSASFLRGVANV